MDRREVIKAINSSIKHWKVMIAWVERQNQEERTSWTRMHKAIKQDWSAEFCSLCELVDVAVAESDAIEVDCKGVCPLGDLFGTCGYSNKINAWGAVDTAKSWGDWLVYAKRLLEQLKDTKIVWLKK